MASGQQIPQVNSLPDSVLESTITRIRRTTARARRAQATDESTLVYIQAGIRLIAEQFSESARKDDEGDESAPPFFAWLSRAKVVAAATDEAQRAGVGRPPSVDQMRDKWEPQSDYVADLLRVAVALEYSYSPAYGDVAAEALSAGNLSDLIHEVAYKDLAGIMSSPVFRIQLFAASISEREPQLRAAIESAYRSIDGGWSALYEGVMEARGLQPRTGITVSDFTRMLTAAAEGLALRGYADSNARVIDHEQRRSLLGTMALGLAAAFCERADAPSDESIEQHLDRVLISGESPGTLIVGEKAAELTPVGSNRTEAHSSLARPYEQFADSSVEIGHPTSWLWTQEKTTAREEAANEVWIMTPDLYWDFQDQVFSAIVFNNVVHRGARYRYLFRGTRENVERATEMRKEYDRALPEDDRSRIQLIAVPEDEFAWCSEQVLYDPGAGPEIENAIICDPADNRDKSNKIDVEIGPSRRILFRTQFVRLWDGYSSRSIATDLVGETSTTLLPPVREARESQPE